MENTEELVKKINFGDNGLIPAIVQDYNSKEVLMLAYMNEEAFLKTLSTKKAWFWSRSRKKLWLKGETSGNFQYVKKIRIDCDEDTVLLLVNPAGPACHTGNRSCFYREIENTKLLERPEIIKKRFIDELYTIIKDRKFNPLEGSYTTYLYKEGLDKICKKIGEESSEVIIAAKNEDNNEIIYETADLFYHLLVLLNLFEISLAEIDIELKNTHK